MRITDKDVTYVADLANLELTPEERQRMVQDLNSILGYVNRLNELDTTDVPPMTQVFAGQETSGAGNDHALREDERLPSLPHELAMKNAPATDGDFFKVPKVIEK